MMDKVLHKMVGPIGRARYRWIDVMGHNKHLFPEIKQSCIDLGFKIIHDYGYYDHTGVPHEFTVEAKNEEADAIFMLTWSCQIDTERFTAEKARKLPADWITHVLYHVTTAGEYHLGLSMAILCGMMLTPVFLEQFYKIRGLTFITIMGLVLMWGLVILRIYDDHRLHKHEIRLRKIDDMNGVNDF